MQVLFIAIVISLASFNPGQDPIITSRQIEKLPTKQLRNLGRFHGSVVDTKGKRIGSASVTVEGANLVRLLKSDRKGQFRLALPVGLYAITVKKAGFAMYKLTNLEIKSGDDGSYICRLELSNPQAETRHATLVIPVN